MKLNTLPKELLILIFAFLDTRSLARTSSVLKEFHKVINSDAGLMQLITKSKSDVKKSDELYRQASSNTIDLEMKCQLLENAYAAAFTHSQKIPIAKSLKQMYKAVFLQDEGASFLDGKALSKDGIALHDKYIFWKNKETFHKKSISKPQENNRIKCVII